MFGNFPIYKWRYKWWVKKEDHTDEKKNKKTKQKWKTPIFNDGQRTKKREEDLEGVVVRETG